MPKYNVAVKETIDYLVPVEAKNKKQASKQALHRLANDPTRNKWVVGVLSIDLDEVHDVETS